MTTPEQTKNKFSTQSNFFNTNNSKHKSKKNLSTYKKDEILTLIRTQIGEESNEETNQMQKEKIKNLDTWFKQYLKVDQDEYEKFKKEKKIENIYGNLKKDLENMKRMNLPCLKEFAKRIDYEKESIMLQNIKITKRKFRFDLFIPDKRRNDKGLVLLSSNGIENGNKVKKPKLALLEDNIDNEYTVKEEEKKDKSKHKYISSGKEIEEKNTFLRNEAKEIEKFYNELDFDSADIVTKTDNYREIIREKIKTERKYKENLIQITRMIMNQELEIEDLHKDISDLMKDHSNINKEARQNMALYNKTIYMNNKIINSIEMRLNSYQRQIDLGQIKYTVKGETEMKELGRERDIIVEENKKYIQKTNMVIEKRDLLLKEVNKKIQSKRDAMSVLEKKTGVNRLMLGEMINEHKQYFLEILNKGVDSRTTGIVWVIKRLIELKTSFSYNMFPKFLSKRDVDYLLELAYKEIDSFKYQILINFYKEKCKYLSEYTKMNIIESKNASPIRQLELKNIKNDLFTEEEGSKEIKSKRKLSDGSNKQLEERNNFEEKGNKTVRFKTNQHSNQVIGYDATHKVINLPHLNENHSPNEEENENEFVTKNSSQKRRSYLAFKSNLKKYSKFNSNKNILFNEAISEESRKKYTDLYNKEKRVNILVYLQSLEEEDTDKKIDFLRKLLNKQHNFNSSLFYQIPYDELQSNIEIDINKSNQEKSYDAYNTTSSISQKQLFSAKGNENLSLTKKSILYNKQGKQLKGKKNENERELDISYNNYIQNNTQSSMNLNKLDNSISIYNSSIYGNRLNCFNHIKNFDDEFKKIFKKEKHIEILSENEKLKYFLDQIVYLRRNLNELNESIDYIKEKKQKEFHKTYKITKATNNYEERIQRDIVSSCLFGNSIAI